MSQTNEHTNQLIKHIAKRQLVPLCRRVLKETFFLPKLFGGIE